jgi:hypothetical protein
MDTLYFMYFGVYSCRMNQVPIVIFRCDNASRANRRQDVLDSPDRAILMCILQN